MVKLEEEFDEEFEELEDFKEEKPEVLRNYDYKSRRILAWVVDKENLQMVEDALGVLLPLATIRLANSEEKAIELFENEEWDTYVADLTEENVSSSEFVKMANNKPNVLFVALNYLQLNRDDEQFATYSEPIRKLFDSEPLNPLAEEQEE